MSLKTLRSHRIFNISIFDIVTAMFGTIILFLIFRKLNFPNLSWYIFIITAIFLTIPIGIIFHVIFGVNTQLNFKLGLSNKPYR